MKRSEFKAIVKECLVEILRDNMEIFQESAPSQGRAKKKTRGQNQKVKRSLMNLVQEQAPRQRPSPQQLMHPQPQIPPQRSGPPSVQEMILSAASTMAQQNAQGEMSSRGIDYAPMSVPQQQVQMHEGHSAYGQPPVPYSSNMMPAQQEIPQGVPIPGDMDGDSHWAKLAFFDQ